MKRVLNLGCVAILCSMSVVLSAVAEDPAKPTGTSKCVPSEWAKYDEVLAKVVNVVDGDTVKIEVSKGKIYNVRFLSIDTPETNYQGMTQGEWADAAKAYLDRTLTPNTLVTVEFDQDRCDSYGRILGHVWKGETNINRAIVQNGYAVNYCIFPNALHCLDYAKLARKNIEEERGMFGKGGPEIPYNWRRNVSGRPYEKYLANIYTYKVYAPDQLSAVPIHARIFFMKKEDIKPPYVLEEGMDDEFSSAAYTH